MNSLKTAEKAFVTQYLLDFNGTKAYQRIKPNTGFESAKTQGSRMLSRVHVKAEIDKRMENQELSTSRTKPFIMDKMVEISDKAEVKGNYQTSLNCWKEVATLQGFYGQSGDGEGYVKLIQTITQNIQINEAKPE